jgi:hypothetical protein
MAKVTWQGGIGNWTDNNWAPNSSPPGSGDDVAIVGTTAVGTQSYVNLDAGTPSVSSLSISGGGDLEIDPGTGLDIATSLSLSTPTSDTSSGITVESTSSFIFVDSGGALTIHGQTQNIDSTIDVFGAASLLGDVTGPGLDIIETGGTLELGGAVSGQTIEFFGPGATLKIDDPAHFDLTNTITGLAPGDVIDLPNIPDPSASVDPTNKLEINTGSATYSLQLDQNYSGFTFQPSPDNANGTEFTVICFFPGTRVATADGEKAIENLQIGDLVTIVGGASRHIRWVGRQTVSTRFGDPLRVLPIRICAEALRKGVPARDLLVSPDHGLLIGDVLVQAGALVNGTTIVREANVPERFTYYHVELDDHSLILAENTPAETLIDHVDRCCFDNWEEYRERYPEGKRITEMRYPRAKSYRQVPRLLREQLATSVVPLPRRKLLRIA